MNAGQRLREAEQRLRRWLDSSAIRPGGRLPSERALAAELQLSHSAVNRAMARLLVEGRVERDGYKLFLPVRSEEESLSLTTCDLVISPRSKSRASLRKVARELGISLREHPWHSIDEAVQCLETLGPPATESVIFVPPPGMETALWEPATQRLSREGIPVIGIGRQTPGISSVFNDHGRALELIFQRLHTLGHRELALLVSSPWTSAIKETTEEWFSLCLRGRMESSCERIVYQNSSQILHEDLAAIAQRLNGEWSQVTALIVCTDDELPIQQLLDLLARHQRAVPRQLSLVSMSDHHTLQTANPPVGAAVADMSLIHETAFLLARRALRKKSLFGLLPPPAEIHVMPEWKDRRSLSPRAPGLAAPKKRKTALSFGEWGEKEDPHLARQRAYDRASDTHKIQWRQLNLRAAVNRPLNFRRGWLGDLPLMSLPPGVHHFHGVPFRILGGPSRGDCGAIVFRSLRNTTGKTAALPTKIRIPIHAPAAAIYILHGCGFGKHLSRFASYTMFHQQERLGQVPVISLGRFLPGMETWALAQAIAEANIQDWWPDYPHCDFEHARMAPLPDTTSAGPTRGHVYLYTLEWINPDPSKVVTHLEIEADPDQSTTLGVLAISLLKPRTARLAGAGAVRRSGRGGGMPKLPYRPKGAGGKKVRG